MFVTLSNPLPALENTAILPFQNAYWPVCGLLKPRPLSPVHRICTQPGSPPTTSSSNRAHVIAAHADLDQRPRAV